jgi:hypothetical protein
MSTRRLVQRCAGGFLVLAAVISGRTYGGVANWAATPADANWSNVAGNWGGTTPSNNTPTFGASTITTLNNDLAGTLAITGASPGYSGVFTMSSWG